MIELMIALWILSFILLGISSIYVNIVITKIKIEKKIDEIDLLNEGNLKEGQDFEAK